MPELPEMQALAERLHELLSGAKLQRADALQFSALKTVQPGPQALAGKELLGVTRRAKYLIFDFGDNKLIAHLSQGGRVTIEDPPKATKPKGSVVRFRFEGRPSVLIKEFGTERKAHWWIVESGDEGPLEGLGPEPTSDEFADLIHHGEDRRRLHTFLRDQRTIAGIGRGFTDEILHRAKLSPFSSLASLDAGQRAELLRSTRSILAEALERERERTGGLPPKITGRFRIHGHYGHPCPVCGELLKRVSYESHEIAYCTKCQTGGKELADRRLSRLLK
jgi:formamidopyrimidine-DNA glycosylase